MGIMEKKMETTIQGCIGESWGYIGILEKKIETQGPFKGIYRDSIEVILG